MKSFCGLKCTVKPHKSLNTSKGIVRCPALSKQICEHILEFMGEQGVTDVRRINVHRDGALKPTNTFVFTFDSPVLPANVKIGFYLLDFFCSGIQFNLLLSPYPCFISLLYLDLYV